MGGNSRKSMKAGVTQKSHGKRDMGFFFFFLFFFLVVDFYPSCLQVPHLEHTAGMLILFLVLYKVV